MKNATLMIALGLCGFANLIAHGQGASSGKNNIVTSNTGTLLTAKSVGELVGADRFYENGYTGSRAVSAVVESGSIWNQHSVLEHVTEFFNGRDTYIENGVDPDQLGEVDRHATWVGHALAGRGQAEYQRGIAYGSELWSGALATKYNGDPYTGSFEWSRGYAFTDAYGGVALTGTGGRTADVVNSSWGGSSETNRGIRGGNNIFTLTYDGMAKQSGAVFVGSVGNEAENPELGSNFPVNGYNGIAVGALGNDLSDPPYKEIASFSTRGAQDYNGPDGYFENVRAVVDIVAPGENLTLAFYGGTTGGNRGGTDPTNGNRFRYTTNAAGTSFSAPIVSGGAALLVDVAYDRFSSNISNAKNGQVIKSVLLNSARKTDNWDNGQRLAGSVITTDQALDYTYGAGSLDLDAAFDQFTAGTTDVSGLGGGEIDQIGWDYGEISEDDTLEYILDDIFDAGTSVNATLNWFVGREWSGTADSGTITSFDDYFTDLSLQFWSIDDQGEFDSLIAISDAKFINTEHLAFELSETGRYGFRLGWEGERYDFIDNNSQTFGFAWNLSSVPEPGTAVLIAMAGCLVALRRRRAA